MNINVDGMTYDVASNSKGNTGVTLGIIGTALGALGGLGNLFGGVNGNPSNYVTKESFDLAQSNSAKDAEIALLKSQNDTDKKLVDVFEAINTKVNEVRDEVRRNKDEQYAVNMQQGIYNATANSAIAVLQTQVASLQSLTKCVIPNTNVCPGWGEVKITPVTQ